MVIINRCVKFHSPADEEHLVERRSRNHRESQLAPKWIALLDSEPAENEVQAFLRKTSKLVART